MSMVYHFIYLYPHEFLSSMSYIDRNSMHILGFQACIENWYSMNKGNTKGSILISVVSVIFLSFQVKHFGEKGERKGERKRFAGNPHQFSDSWFFFSITNGYKE